MELRRRRDTAEALAAWSTERPKLLTLTYDDVAQSWRDRGRLRSFLNAMRTNLTRRGYTMRYFWMAEMQERCALHIHVVLIGCPYLDRKTVQRWWKRGFKDIRAISTKKALRYITSYVEKGVGQERPVDLVRHVLHSLFKARRFGCSRDISHRDVPMPGWIAEYATMLGCDLADVEWEASGELDEAWIFYGGDLIKTLRWKETSWRILTELLSWPMQSSTSTLSECGA